MKVWRKYYRANFLTKKVTEQPFAVDFTTDMVLTFLTLANFPDPKHTFPHSYCFIKFEDGIEVEESSA